jgi:hypothetical protein
MVISRATTGSSRGPDGQLAVDGLEFGAMEVELADQRFDTAPLIARQLLLAEPVSASPTASRPSRSDDGRDSAASELRCCGARGGVTDRQPAARRGRQEMSLGLNAFGSTSTSQLPALSRITASTP